MADHRCMVSGADPPVPIPGHAHPPQVVPTGSPTPLPSTAPPFAPVHRIRVRVRVGYRPGVGGWLPGGPWRCLPCVRPERWAGSARYPPCPRFTLSLSDQRSGPLSCASGGGRNEAQPEVGYDRPMVASLGGKPTQCTIAGRPCRIRRGVALGAAHRHTDPPPSASRPRPGKDRLDRHGFGTNRSIAWAASGHSIGSMPIGTNGVGRLVPPQALVTALPPMGDSGWPGPMRQHARSAAPQGESGISLAVPPPR